MVPAEGFLPSKLELLMTLAFLVELTVVGI
jgi:hypothetical protein